jgi:ABC-type uncharacterized transport system auxiliary subunit
MRTKIILTAACLSALAGCAPKAVVRKYYVLEAGAAADSTFAYAHPLPFTAGFLELKVARVFDQDRIALRTGSHELSYYYYHQWAVRPSSSVSEAVFRIIRGSNLFSRLERNPSVEIHYTLTGQLDRLERTSDGKKDAAHLSGEFQLLDSGENPVLLHSFDRSVVLEPRRDMNAFADAVNRIVLEETVLFIRKIAGRLNPSDEAER